MRQMHWLKKWYKWHFVVLSLVKENRRSQTKDMFMQDGYINIFKIPEYIAKKGSFCKFCDASIPTVLFQLDPFCVHIRDALQATS